MVRSGYMDYYLSYCRKSRRANLNRRLSKALEDRSRRRGGPRIKGPPRLTLSTTSLAMYFGQINFTCKLGLTGVQRSPQSNDFAIASYAPRDPQPDLRICHGHRYH
jgi:hypothetical protein